MKRVFIAIMASAALLSGCTTTQNHDTALTKAIRAIAADEVYLSDLVAFDWDKVFSFTPYTSKERIEDIIGFKSNHIKETVNEGMTQLLFTQGNEVVSSIMGYSSDLGFHFIIKDFKADHIVLLKEDNPRFRVQRLDGVLYLTHIE